LSSQIALNGQIFAVLYTNVYTVIAISDYLVVALDFLTQYTSIEHCR